MVTVNPSTYYTAGKDLAEIGNAVATAVKQTLAPEVSGIENVKTKGMGGNHPQALAWNTRYKQSSDDLYTLAAAVSDAAQRFADILNVCGYNWDTSNYNANPKSDKGTAPTKPTLAANPLFGDKDVPKTPDPTNDNGDGLTFSGGAPKWSGTLISALKARNVTFPNGDTDLLAAAAKGWQAFAASDAVTGSSAKLGQIADSFASVDAPEKDDIVQTLHTLQQGAQRIAAAAKGIATAVGNHHDQLTTLRDGVDKEAPKALPDLLATAVSMGTNVNISALDGAQPDVINSAADDFTAIWNRSGLPGVWAAAFEGCDNLGSISDIAGIATLAVPKESGNAADNQSVAAAIDATTVVSTVDGVDDKGQPTKTITMKDGSKTVATQTTTTDPDNPGSAAQPTVKYDQYDKNGKLLSTTVSYKGTSGETRQLTTLYKDGAGSDQTKVLKIAGVNSDDPGTTIITLPDGRSASGPYEWFSHPNLDGVGGAASAADKFADLKLSKLPTTDIMSESEKGLRDIKAGSSFIGPGATVAAGVLDVMSGNASPLQAAGSTVAQIGAGDIGADVGGTLGALVPGAEPITIPAGAALGAIAGGEIGGWLFDKAWKLGD
ncbi:hypothetical protein GPX89_17110 [Nocardia sp. ET3-3]|uniref:Uncharacterized protein n=1 Tax=Nocardia terrae TaxID=2675851 RepID=A0A7K1UXP5_9NOCA|nr:hypothetical protein [Nocardia terrae]MVU78959.1 hypothetical protein [Nocardia terrae]